MDTLELREELIFRGKTPGSILSTKKEVYL